MVAEELCSRVFGGDLRSLDLLTANKRKVYNYRIYEDDKCTHMPSSKLKRSRTAGRKALYGELENVHTWCKR